MLKSEYNCPPGWRRRRAPGHQPHVAAEERARRQEDRPSWQRLRRLHRGIPQHAVKSWPVLTEASSKALDYPVDQN